MAPKSTPYREFLPDLSIPRFTTMKTQNAHEYAAAFKENKQPPWLHGLYVRWQQLWAEPYRGLTNDGTVRPDLFTLQNEGIGAAAADAADTVVALAKADAQFVATHKQLVYHVDDPTWRMWSNPEFLLSDRGVRLDEVGAGLRDACLKVIEAALSPEGYAKARGAMRINGFLGDLVGSPAVMNDLSYNLVLYGTPGFAEAYDKIEGTPRPWGFSFYGHHLCLNAFFIGTQMVLSPVFVGAEPNVIDDGPHKGTRILTAEDALGLQLMQSLSPELQAHATVYKSLHDPAMPRGRWNHDDQRHLCGASRDNRVVPYEGVNVGDTFDDAQKELLLQILGEFLILLPLPARTKRLDLIRRFLPDTFFCWIGGHSDDDAFYYRIQSPVILVEFDHHSGVFLTNKEPARFHIHTLIRTPNAGDYGMALRPLIPSTVQQKFLWEG